MKKEDLLLLYDKELFFRKLISKESNWFGKFLFRSGIKILIIILTVILFFFLLNNIFVLDEYKDINQFLGVLIMLFSGIIFLVAWLDDLGMHLLLRKYYSSYLKEKEYKIEKFLILREIQADYLFKGALKEIRVKKVRKIRKGLKEDSREISETFELSDSTFAVLLIPLGLAILQWHFSEVKDFRVVYGYSMLYLIFVLATFFTYKYLKNTYYTVKKEKYKKLIYILKLVEIKIKEKERKIKNL
jgi:hypothetical protein